MKTSLLTILLLTLPLAGCSAMIDLKDFDDCGNGELDPGEDCDEGPDNSDNTDGACRTNCREAHCGDGFTNPSLNEVCDSGEDNGLLGRCNESCTGETVEAECGNDVVEGDEECDDGVANGEYGMCNLGCTGLGPHCGDGIAQDVEDCDGSDVNQTCGDLGYEPGGLGCTTDCRYDLNFCTSPPGCHAVEQLTCGGTVISDTLTQGSHNNLISHCMNSGSQYTGRERTFFFLPQSTRQVEIRLQELSVDLDVLVYLDNGNNCVGLPCMGGSVLWELQDESLRFVAMAGVGYYIVVDGVDGQSGSFGLSLDCFEPENCTAGTDGNGDGYGGCADPECVRVSSQCQSPPELACDDGFDNDGDSMPDCADPDCSGMAFCQCTVTEPNALQCGSVVDGANFGPGSVNEVNAGWCGTATNALYGSERIYEVNVEPPDGNVQILVTQLTADLDAYVLASPNMGCQVQGCADPTDGFEAGLTDEIVQFTPLVGMQYYLVVDGWSWAKGNYQIQVSCTP